MATSGSYNFSVTRDNLLLAAHQHIGAVGEGETLTTAQTTESALLLNMITKLRAADGMPLWALKRGYVLPFSGASSIATTSHVVTDYTTTTLSAAEAAAQTVLSVTSSTGMTAADQVGIELTSGNIDWTTIVSVDSSTQITVTTALTGAAASGSRVYSYTASSDRVENPLRILEANILDVGDNSSWEIQQIARRDYYGLGDRTDEGTPNQFYYSPELDNGVIFIYPRFEDGDKIIEFTYHRPFADFDASSDTPDFPQAFYLPLMLELAALLGPKFGVAIDERKALHAEARMYLDQALVTVAPEGSLFIQPDNEK